MIEHNAILGEQELGNWGIGGRLLGFQHWGIERINQIVREITDQTPEKSGSPDVHKIESLEKRSDFLDCLRSLQIPTDGQEGFFPFLMIGFPKSDIQLGLGTDIGIPGDLFASLHGFQEKTRAAMEM